MSNLTIKNVKVAGISACVPEKIEENIYLPIFASKEEAQKVIDSTGIVRKHVVDPDTTASDLAVVAANQIINELGWEKESIDVLVYVSQSRDYIAPMTSCILQDKLGLSKGCFVMDVPFGCCGFVHGMSVAASMLSHGLLKRGLMINAETNSLNRSKKDRTVRPLFADAATVTALEFDENAKDMKFSFGVDGSGAAAVMMEYGGMRHPITPESLVEREVAPGIIRKGNDMVVNGMDVFSFAIKVPPKALKEFISDFEVNVDEIDLLVLHQANKFIDEKIRKNLKVPAEKVPYCLQEYGNVTCASIPLTLVSQCAHKLQTEDCNILASGFGVGLQWGCMQFSTSKIKCPEVSIYTCKGNDY